MSALIIYLLKANLLIFILFIFYFLLLRNEKFLYLNRLFLLGTLVLPMVLPLLPLSGLFASAEEPSPSGLPVLLNIYSQIQLGAGTYPLASAAADSPTGLRYAWSLPEILLAVYGFVSLVLLLRVVYRVLSVNALIRDSRQRSAEGIIYCTSAEELAPFSFFQYLVMNDSQHNTEEARQIILHEQAHIRQRHTIDLLLSEFVFAVLWINPISHLLKKHLQLNLEYLADADVLGKGMDRKSYQLNILQGSLKSAAKYPLTNLFHSSKLKLRIKMMNMKKTSNSHLYKYLLVLPVVAATYAFVTPLNVEALKSNMKKLYAERTAQHLKAFEGYYTFTFQNDASPSFIQISVKDTTLILRQDWDGQEISFKQTAPLEFFSAERNFPLKFTKDGKGEITQVLAFNRDLWNRAKDYKPPVPKTAMRLSPQQLKAYEGTYSMTGNDGTAYLQFTATATGLILKQQWDGKEFTFSPETETDFFCNVKAFTLKFTKNGQGNVTDVLAFGKDRWTRVNK